MEKKKILAVDDDPTILEMLKTGLTNAGYVVETAESEADVKIAINKFKPDAILMDINIPGVDGISMCRTIRFTENMSKVPIIMITAYTDEKTFHDAMLFGATDYIVKPFDFVDVQKKIEDAIVMLKSQKGK